MSTDMPTTIQVQRTVWPVEPSQRAVENLFPRWREGGDTHPLPPDSRAEILPAELTAIPELPSLIPPAAARMVREPIGACSCADMVYDALGFHSALLSPEPPAVRQSRP